MKSDFGRNKNRGCDNGRIFFSSDEPLDQVNKDMWLNPDALNTLYIKKSSSTSRASTTTLTDDPHLTVDLPKNGIFNIDVYLNAEGPTNADIKVDFDLYGGLSALSLYKLGWGPAEGITDMTFCQLKLISDPVEDAINYGTAPSQYSSILINMLLQTGSTAGNLTVQWAQAISNPTPVVLGSSSKLIIKQLAGDVSLLKWYSSDSSAWEFIV